MPDIYISIISHGHEQILKDTKLIERLKPFRVIVRENKFQQWSENLNHTELNFNPTPLGYGANHNLNFNSVVMQDDDWFVICNPDIEMDSSDVKRLTEIADKEGILCMSVPLFSENGTFDRNYRGWPSLIGLLISYFSKTTSNSTLSNNNKRVIEADWISGALIFIKSATYRKIAGFDERYFMYMEDVDLCRKLEKENISRNILKYDKIIHHAARDNRRLFSKPMFWHINSIIKYFVKWGIN